MSEETRKVHFLGEMYPRTVTVGFNHDHGYTPPTSYVECDLPFNSLGPWKIGYGIHRGTLTSRDEDGLGQTVYESWDAVLAAARVIANNWRDRGYAIWYANAYPINGGEPARILIGAPYER